MLTSKLSSSKENSSELSNSSSS